MKNRFLPFIAVLLLPVLLLTCRDDGPAFAPGTVDSRLAGTWRLVERRFPRDSTYTVRIDTITTRRDTSFYTTRRYPAAPPQTLTFNSDGTLSADGSEMSYFHPISYFRVDATYPDSLSVDFFITTNRANVPFRQGLALRQDTLLLRPRCEQPCYLKLVRVR